MEQWWRFTFTLFWVQCQVPITNLSKWQERGTLNRQEGFVQTEGCMVLLEKQMPRTLYNTAVGLSFSLEYVL